MNGTQIYNMANDIDDWVMTRELLKCVACWTEVQPRRDLPGREGSTAFRRHPQDHRCWCQKQGPGSHVGFLDLPCLPMAPVPWSLVVIRLWGCQLEKTLPAWPGWPIGSAQRASMQCQPFLRTVEGRSPRSSGKLQVLKNASNMPLFLWPWPQSRATRRPRAADKRKAQPRRAKPTANTPDHCGRQEGNNTGRAIKVVLKTKQNKKIVPIDLNLESFNGYVFQK